LATKTQASNKPHMYRITVCKIAQFKTKLRIVKNRGRSSNNQCPIRLAYQPPVNNTFLSKQTSNQSTVLFSQTKSALAISHQPNERAVSRRHAHNSFKIREKMHITCLEPGGRSSSNQVGVMHRSGTVRTSTCGEDQRNNEQSYSSLCTIDCKPEISETERRGRLEKS
jgi:hypothetical protein